MPLAQHYIFRLVRRFLTQRGTAEEEGEMGSQHPRPGVPPSAAARESHSLRHDIWGIVDIVVRYYLILFK